MFMWFYMYGIFPSLAHQHLFDMDSCVNFYSLVFCLIICECDKMFVKHHILYSPRP